MVGIYTQSRVIPGVGNFGYWTRTSPTGVVQGVPNRSGAYDGDQVTTSFRNSGDAKDILPEDQLSSTVSSINNLYGNVVSTFDNGHPFNTVKREAFGNFPVSTYDRGDLGVYKTPFVTVDMLNIYKSSWPTIPPWKSRLADGNTAILKTYPTAPKASLSQALVELHNEGLPSMIGAQILSMKGNALKSLGSEYLNSVFGLTPLVKDLEKLLKAVVNSSQILQQLQRDSGRVVRRKYSFPVTTSIVDDLTYTDSARALPDSGSPLYGRTGQFSTTTTITTKVWFSGAYTYHLDPGKTLLGQAAKYEALANHLLGTRITPDVLWNLAPWSWLADWYANVGKNIAVASAFQQDGLVLKYGYLMRQVTAQKLYQFVPGDLTTKLYNPAPSSLVLRTTSKERVRSSPFGFAVNEGQFTDRQWAILGSLGMTKAPRALR